jgi:hypothetical protein
MHFMRMANITPRNANLTQRIFNYLHKVTNDV